MTKEEIDHLKAEILEDIRKASRHAHKGKEFDPAEFERRLSIRITELLEMRKKGSGLITDFT